MVNDVTDAGYSAEMDDAPHRYPSGREPVARVRRAPEGFLSPSQIADVQAGRRGFLRKALLGAAGATASLTLNSSLAQSSIDAKADSGAIFIRFNVNVGGAFRVGAFDQVGDKPRHRGFILRRFRF